MLLCFSGSSIVEEEVTTNTSISQNPNGLKSGEHVAAFWLQDDGTYAWYLGNIPLPSKTRIFCYTEFD